MTQRKFSFWTIAALGLVTFLTGCQSRFNNLTPERIPQNPSGLYTFSFGAQLIATNVVEDSERATITINGESFPMVRSDEGGRIFTYDYAMPLGLNEARYFFTLEYDYTNLGGSGTNAFFSTDEEGGVYVARLINRYAIQLVADRGPPGATIDLVGSGFSPGDVIIIGGQAANTTINDGNSLDFVVPFLQTGMTYDVALRTAQGELPVGRFRVDPARSGSSVAMAGGTTGGTGFNSEFSSGNAGALSVFPPSLELFEGESLILLVQLSGVAPPGGLAVDVTTDVPESVIMPEVVIPAGAQTVSVSVEGGIPGSGNLYLTIPGSPELVVPVIVE